MEFPKRYSLSIELRYKVLLRDLRREPLLHLEQTAELAPGDVVAFLDRKSVV